MDRRPAWWVNWQERHQTPLSYWLHVVGIPLTIGAAALAVSQAIDGAWDQWWRPLLLLILGYGLQYLGHVHEGNDMGEVILVKRWLRMPYVAVAPQFRRRSPQAAELSLPSEPVGESEG